MRTIFFIAYLMLQSFFCTKAQQEAYPQIGKPLPLVYFNDVNYHDKPILATNDLKGKWLVLYAWNRYCSLCLNKMPQLNQMKDKFVDRLNILLVGYNGSRYTKRNDDQAIRRLYENNKEEMGLKLAIAYDSVMFHRFNIGPSPYIIIVDPNGVVRYLTTGFDELQLQEIIDGKEVLLKKAYRRDERLNRPK